MISHLSFDGRTPFLPYHAWLATSGHGYDHGRLCAFVLKGPASNPVNRFRGGPCTLGQIDARQHKQDRSSCAGIGGGSLPWMIMCFGFVRVLLREGKRPAGCLPLLQTYLWSSVWVCRPSVCSGLLSGMDGVWALQLNGCLNRVS